MGENYKYTMIDDDTSERFVTGGIYQKVLPYERLVSPAIGISMMAGVKRSTCLKNTSDSHLEST